MRLCNIYTDTIHGYIDLAKHEIIRRKCGIFTNKIKLPQLTKKLNIKAKFPMRTTSKCSIFRQLWKKVEKETLDILQITYQYSEEDVLELQNQMEDEFTAICRTPNRIPRTVIAKAPETQALKNHYQ